MSLGNMAVKGSLWSFAATGGQQALQFGFFIFLARVLEPSAFGLLAMATVMLDLMAATGRIGQTEVLVQRPTQNDVVMNRVFWFLQLIGVAQALVMAGTSHWMAAWFKAPDLQNVLLWFAPIVWLQNMGIVHEARLRRHFGFKSLAHRMIGGTLAGGVVGVVFAACGFGVYSLVLQRITSVIFQIALLWSADPWRPTLQLRSPDAEPFWPLIRTGIDIMVGQLVGMLNTRLVDVIIGFFMGAAVLGYLRIAWRTFDFVLQLAIQPIVNVALSVASKLKDDKPRLTKAYRRMVELAALGSAPIFLGLAAVSPLAVEFCFGAKWLPAAPLLQIMSPMALAAAVSGLFPPFMTAGGQSRWFARQSLIQVALTALLTLIAVHWSLNAVVAAHALRSLLMCLLCVYLMQRFMGISAMVTVQAVRPALIAALGMAAVVTAARLAGLVDGLPLWLGLLILAVLGAVVYAGLLVLVFRNHLYDLINDIKWIMKTPKGA